MAKKINKKYTSQAEYIASKRKTEEDEPKVEKKYTSQADYVAKRRYTDNFAEYENEYQKALKRYNLVQETVSKHSNRGYMDDIDNKRLDDAEKRLKSSASVLFNSPYLDDKGRKEAQTYLSDLSTGIANSRTALNEGKREARYRSAYDKALEEYNAFVSDPDKYKYNDKHISGQRKRQLAEVSDRLRAAATDYLTNGGTEKSAALADLNANLDRSNADAEFQLDVQKYRNMTREEREAERGRLISENSMSFQNGLPRTDFSKLEREMPEYDPKVQKRLEALKAIDEEQKTPIDEAAERAREYTSKRSIAESILNADFNGDMDEAKSAAEGGGRGTVSAYANFLRERGSGAFHTNANYKPVTYREQQADKALKLIAEYEQYRDSGQQSYDEYVRELYAGDPLGNDSLKTKDSVYHKALKALGVSFDGAAVDAKHAFQIASQTFRTDSGGGAAFVSEGHNRDLIGATYETDKDGNVKITSTPPDDVKELLFRNNNYMLENWSVISTKEWALYYALIGEGKAAAAYDYIRSLTPALENRNRDEAKQIINEGFDNLFGDAASVVQPVVSLFGSVPFKFAGAVGSLANMAAQEISGGKYDPYDTPMPSIVNTAGTITREATNERINEKSSIGSFLYGAAQSVVDMYAGAGLGKALGGIVGKMGGSESLVNAAEHIYEFIMGSDAATSRARELYDRGVSQDKILLGSLSAGITETAFEHLSLEHFLRTPDSFANFGKKLRHALAQAGVEGSEEFFTDIANELWDSVILGNDSDFNYSIKNHLAEGMSYQDARNAAAKEATLQKIESAVAGFLSGGVGMMGYVAGAANESRQNYRIGKNVESNAKTQETLDTIAAQQGEGIQSQKLAADLKQRQADGKKIGKEALGIAVSQYYNEQSQKANESFDKIRSLAEQKYDLDQVKADLVSRGMTESEAAAVAPAVVKNLNDEQANRKERRTAEYNKTAKEYIDETKANAEAEINSAVEDFNNTIETLDETRAYAETPNYNSAAAFFEHAKSVPLPKAELSSQDVRTANTVEKGAISSDSNAHIKESSAKAVGIDPSETFTISKAVRTEDGKIGVELSNGKTVSVNDIEFANADDAIIWGNLASIDGIAPEAVNMLIKTRELTDKGVPAGVWAQGVKAGYMLGNTMRVGSKEFLKAERANPYLRNISNEARIQSEKLGREAAKRTAKLQNRAEANVKSGETRKQQLDRAKALADRLGRKISIDDSTKGDGYIDKDGTIHVGQKTVDPVAFVVKHELTHFGETSPLYKAFETAVTGSKAFASWIDNQVVKDGTTLQQKAAYIVAIKNRYAAYGVVLDNKAAHAEMIANFVGDMLFTEQGAGLDGMTSGLSVKDKNAVLRYIEKFLSWLKSKFRGDEFNIAWLEKLYNEMQSTATADRGEGRYDLSENSPAFAKSAQGTMLQDLSYHLADAEHQIGLLENYDFEGEGMDKETLLDNYKETVQMWKDISKKLKSTFLNEWNKQDGKNRVFSIFKAQSGYKYNAEFSSMCKKGVPLFEAIDKIVTDKRINGKYNAEALDATTKEILYTILKDHGFDIPCSICYVEQARRREGSIISNFLNGSKDGKIGWNTTLTRIENDMKSQGFDYTFDTLDDSFLTDAFEPKQVAMTESESDAFYRALINVTNDEIEKLNDGIRKSNAKNNTNDALYDRISESTPEAFAKALEAIDDLPLNLVLLNTLAFNPDSRFRFEELQLFSSMATYNLNRYYHDLYSLFNRQGGASGMKTKQKPIPYMSDILQTMTVSSEDTRKAGGIRNQSNSDFQMYLFLDYAQMYADLTAKRYYLQAYTKVLSELKLFGKSNAKLNASFLPKVYEYKNADGTIDIAKTRENAGLDPNGNPLYDDVEGINHTEAFAIVTDKEYSKNCCGICVGYSDKHITALLNEPRIQMVIGFHDNTDDPAKRYPGAKYAMNYKGRNEAKRKSNGKTVHVNFNDFVLKAHDMVGKKGNTVEYKNKSYGWNDVPKLATALYLDYCEESNLYPAYSSYGKGLTDFSKHDNYYKLLADYGLYDSEGNYAPHKPVSYQLPETVPYRTKQGKMATMKSSDFIAKELRSEMKMREDLAVALADDSEKGIIPQFVKAMDERFSKPKAEKPKSTKRGVKHSLPESITDEDYLSAVESGNMKTAQKMVDEAAKAAGYTFGKVYHGTPNSDFTAFNNGIIFFTSNKDTASEYQDPGVLWATRYDKGRTIGAYIKLDNPLMLDNSYSDYRNEHTPWQEWKPTAYGRVPENAMNAREVAERAKAEGYDGVFIANDKDTKWTDSSKYLKNRGRGDTVIAFMSNQIKSADPVTYDDNGNVIPLSKRFNPENDDIRYSIPDSVSPEDENLAREWLGKIDEYGAFPEGENNTSGIQTPQQVNDTTRVHRFVSNVLGDNTISAEFARELGKETLFNRRSYEVESDAKAARWLQDASQGEIEERANSLLANRNDQISKLDVVATEYLIKQAIEQNDLKKALDLEANLSAMLTQAGQTIQAASLFKQMTPYGKLMSLQKALTTINDQVPLGRKKAHIDEDMAMYLLGAGSQEEMEKIGEEIVADVASQYDSSFIDKWNTWRYMSMLINPKTHIRNIVGNAAFVLPVYLKDAFAAMNERFLKLDKSQRTKVGWVKKEYKQMAKAICKSEDVQKQLRTAWGNYKNSIEMEKQVFKHQPFKWLERVPMGWLETEDMWFKNIHYIHALGGFLQARGVDPKANTHTKDFEKLLIQGHRYALEQAYKNTYNDINAFAKAISDLGRKHVAARFVLDSVLPFKKTPANIIKRGVEYSPIGFANAITRGMISAARTQKVEKAFQNGEMSKGDYNKFMASDRAFDANKFVDSLSAGFTGSLVFLLGYLLSSLGILRGRFRDDKDKFLKNLGAQEYALEIFGGSYTIDWLAPINMPLLMGEEFGELLKESDEDNPRGLSTITKPMLQAFQPVINLSMLEGVQNSLESIKYSEDEMEIPDYISSVASGYFGQVMPTFLGAISRISDPLKRTSYTSNHSNIDRFVQNLWNNFRAKVPGLSSDKPPYVDVWGRTKTTGGAFERHLEALISPGYWENVDYDDVSKEVLRVYDKTKKKEVFPQKPAKYIEVDNEKKYLDEWGYAEYSIKKGTYSYAYVADATKDKNYNALEANDKAAVLAEIYRYSNAKAKGDVSDYDISTDAGAYLLYGLEKNGKSIVDYIATVKVPLTRFAALVADGEIDGAIQKYLDIQETASDDYGEKISTSAQGDFTSYYKPLYIAAVENDDGDEVSRIRSELTQIIDKTHLYTSKTYEGDVDKIFSSWAKAAGINGSDHTITPADTYRAQVEEGNSSAAAQTFKDITKGMSSEDKEKTRKDLMSDTTDSLKPRYLEGDNATRKNVKTELVDLVKAGVYKKNDKDSYEEAADKIIKRWTSNNGGKN